MRILGILGILLALLIGAGVGYLFIEDQKQQQSEFTKNVDRIREGMVLIQESDANPGNRIHVDDLASCCIAALSDKAPAGIYNIGDGDFRSPTWFSTEVARQCELTAPRTISWADAQKEFSEMRLSFFKESRRIDTRKMRDILDVTPRYANPEDGIRASLLPRV